MEKGAETAQKSIDVLGLIPVLSTSCTLTVVVYHVKYKLPLFC